MEARLGRPDVQSGTLGRIAEVAWKTKSVCRSGFGVCSLSLCTHLFREGAGFVRCGRPQAARHSVAVLCLFVRSGRS